MKLATQFLVSQLIAQIEHPISHVFLYNDVTRLYWRKSQHHTYREAWIALSTCHSPRVDGVNMETTTLVHDGEILWVTEPFRVLRSAADIEFAVRDVNAFLDGERIQGDVPDDPELEAIVCRDREYWLGGGVLSFRRASLHRDPEEAKDESRGS